MDLPEQIDKRGNFISTYSGARFFIDECNIQDIPMQDIAHALSMNCRFNGHLKRFYSVAEHSALVSRLVPTKYALWGLLHDATEAFVPDVPRPFKGLIYGFQEFEDRLMEKIADHFDLEYPMPDDVKYIDKHIVGDEAEALFQKKPAWTQYYDHVCDPKLIKGLSPDEAELGFMNRFKELTQ